MDINFHPVTWIIFHWLNFLFKIKYMKKHLILLFVVTFICGILSCGDNSTPTDLVPETYDGNPFVYECLKYDPRTHHSYVKNMNYLINNICIQGMHWWLTLRGCFFFLGKIYKDSRGTSTIIILLDSLIYILRTRLPY